MLACLTRRERVMLGVVGLVVTATAALEYGGGSDVAVFIVAALALAGVAWVVSFSTEAVGERFGPALTGVLQSTLGNLPELFVVGFLRPFSRGSSWSRSTRFSARSSRTPCSSSAS